MISFSFSGFVFVFYSLQLSKPTTSHCTLNAQTVCLSSERGTGSRGVLSVLILLFFVHSFLISLFFSKNSIPSLSLSIKIQPFLPLQGSLYPPTQQRDVKSHNQVCHPNQSASIVRTRTQHKPTETKENTKNKCKPK